MQWLLGDDENDQNKLLTLNDILRVAIADPFEKWSDDEKDTESCPDRLGLHDNRFRLLG